MLAFFAMPAAHCLHLRASNPLSNRRRNGAAVATVTKGAGSRTKELLMADKRLEIA